MIIKLIELMSGASGVLVGIIVWAVLAIAVMRELGSAMFVRSGETEEQALSREYRSNKRLIAELRNWWKDAQYGTPYKKYGEIFHVILQKYEVPFDPSIAPELWEELNAWLELRPELPLHLREELRALLLKYGGNND